MVRQDVKGEKWRSSQVSYHTGHFKKTREGSKKKQENLVNRVQPTASNSFECYRLNLSGALGRSVFKLNRFTQGPGEGGGLHKTVGQS